MNGRVFDGEIGRFISPDPIVQVPTNSQSWNRYSYVFNRPLKFTDPTGFECQDDQDDKSDKAIEDCPESNAPIEEIIVTGVRSDDLELDDLRTWILLGVIVAANWDEVKKGVKEVVDNTCLSMGYQFSMTGITPGLQSNGGPASTGLNLQWFYGRNGLEFRPYWIIGGGVGSDFTVTGEAVYAVGTGNWPGPSNSINGGWGSWSGSVFASQEGQGNYIGFTVGYGRSIYKATGSEAYAMYIPLGDNKDTPVCQ